MSQCWGCGLEPAPFLGFEVVGSIHGYCGVECLAVAYERDARPWSTVSKRARRHKREPLLPFLIPLVDTPYGVLLTDECTGCRTPLPVGTVGWSETRGECEIYCYACALKDQDGEL